MNRESTSITGHVLDSSSHSHLLSDDHLADTKQQLSVGLVCCVEAGAPTLFKTLTALAMNSLMFTLMSSVCGPFKRSSRN